MDAVAEQVPGDAGDGELLRQFVVDRRESAFAAIVRRHGGMVFGVCRAVLGESHDAEDAAQAVFLTLATKARSLEKHATIAGWLHRVAWYTATRAREAGEIRRRHEKEYSEMRNATAPIHENPIEPEALHAALAELPEKYRLPLLLHYVEGRSEAETAALLGIGASSASMRLSRGREKLRQKLAKRGVATPATGMAVAMGMLAGAGMPEKFAASATKAAVAILSGHASTIAVSASASALSKGALSMLVRTKIKSAVVISATALLLGGAAATTYVIAENVQPRSAPIALASDTGPATQPESPDEIKAAKEKLAAIRKHLEDTGHAHATGDQKAVVDAGFDYLAEHLHDSGVAAFEPLSGFTDYTVGKSDGGLIVLLLDNTDAHNGLNISIDPNSGNAIDANFWGERPAK